MSGHESSIKAISFALAANLGIAISKTIAAIITGSGSMLAESIHSFADTTNQILLFIGMNRANRSPNKEHPLGFGKVIYFWSFIVAILLFSLGGLFSIYEGIHKILKPEHLTNPIIAIIVLIISIFLESASLLGALKQVKKIRGKKNLYQWLKTSRNAELIVVLGEDIAALVGLSIAFLFVLLTMITGSSLFDALGSISIGVVLITISILISIRIQSLLIGISASQEICDLISQFIIKDNNIIEVFNIITMQMGPNIMLAAKIRLKNGIIIEDICVIINNLEKDIKSNFPEIKWIFVEPDICD